MSSDGDSYMDTPEMRELVKQFFSAAEKTTASITPDSEQLIRDWQQVCEAHEAYEAQRIHDDPLYLTRKQFAEISGMSSKEVDMRFEAFLTGFKIIETPEQQLRRNAWTTPNRAQRRKQEREQRRKAGKVRK
jgi:hypothetical protein